MYVFVNSYFSNSAIYVVIQTKPSTQSVKFGVTQGSIPGLLLFMVVTNDIDCNVDQWKSVLYAD